jgi:hypothetical protein
MKFSLRDLFLVTMIVAILVAWRLDHRRLDDKIGQMSVQTDFLLPSRFTAPVTKLPGAQMP